jgi:hypothetical protein
MFTISGVGKVHTSLNVEVFEDKSRPLDVDTAKKAGAI